MLSSIGRQHYAAVERGSGLFAWPLSCSMCGEGQFYNISIAGYVHKAENDDTVFRPRGHQPAPAKINPWTPKYAI